MSLIEKISYARKFTPALIFRKIIHVFSDLLTNRSKKKVIVNNDLRVNLINTKVVTSLIPFDNPNSKSNVKHSSELFSHSFNILGSGPVTNSYTLKANGFLNNSFDHSLNITKFDNDGYWLKNIVHPLHLPFSIECWQVIRTINPTYQPIDWQLDIKSGFRWTAQQWFKAQTGMSIDLKGVDIKVPWELSRLQHLLPILVNSKESLDIDSQKVKTEVICQMLDFIMANPIGMGVNFNCPMDIGIRNANILLVIDYLKTDNGDHILTPEIESIIANYVEHSTTHILENLEYRDGLTSNHYLGNILGVLFAGAYLDYHANSDQWLAFGIQEIERCMARQFFRDGSNFEGSTSYHRLSGEMMVWAAGLILSIPESRIQRLKEYSNNKWSFKAPLFKKTEQQFLSTPFLLSDDFWSKLILAGSFSENITKNNGDVCQFGDNDSGRFVKITRTGKWLNYAEARKKYLNLDHLEDNKDSTYWDENYLSHSSFISSVSGLSSTNTGSKESNFYENNLFQNIANHKTGFTDFITSLSKPRPKAKLVSTIPTEYDFFKEKIVHFPNGNIDIATNTTFEYFSDFQLVIIKNDNLYLALGGISNPNQHHSLGHTHNDKLAIELRIDQTDVLFNPGTFVYTPEPPLRNMFRSVRSHNTISINNQEQNRALPGKMGLFNLKAETKFRLLELTVNQIIAEVKYRDIVHQRRIEIKSDRIVIQDWCNQEFEQHWNTGKPYSNGYGKRLA
ncbi:MAG: hypothetical protein ACI9JN_002715 [Bacteroidia bacterium]